MNKLVDVTSSIIAQHYGLAWHGHSLTLRRWGSVGCLSSLFFVSVFDGLVLVDRVNVSAEEQGMRLKLPSFHISPRMINQISGNVHRVWYLVADGELFWIKDREFDRLLHRVRITIVGDDMNHFEQDVIGPDIEIRQDYIPGRGRQRRDYWKNHLNRKPRPVLVAS